MDKQSSIQGRETTSAEVSWATLPRMLSGECSRSETMGMDEEASRRREGRSHPLGGAAREL